MLPGARIIQCRRHPVDTCLSIYFTHFKQVIGFATDKADLAGAYQQYARLMDHWRMVLPPGRFLEVDYEALIADREAVTRRLIAFTGLDWDDACLQPERNQHAVVTASRWQARQPVYATSVGRWRHYEPWLGELRCLLPDGRAGGSVRGADGDGRRRTEKIGGGCREGSVVGKFYARSSRRTVGKIYNNWAAAAIGVAVSC